MILPCYLTISSSSVWKQQKDIFNRLSYVFCRSIISKDQEQKKMLNYILPMTLSFLQLPKYLQRVISAHLSYKGRAWQEEQIWKIQRRDWNQEPALNTETVHKIYLTHDNGLCAYNAAELKMENKPSRMLSVIEAGNKKPQITIVRDLGRKGHKPFGDCRWKKCFGHPYDTIQK